ncbi:transcription factor HES-7 [Sceloporus undulatus]|uniref:transcription factor HES-7 n=1 Tax=Sceloporus undulatus TaxID=8520 RepID=UPI001C4BAB3E|nr:transcription factor HES-7 [Sceloporus undulatus]
MPKARAIGGRTRLVPVPKARRAASGPRARRRPHESWHLGRLAKPPANLEMAQLEPGTAAPERIIFALTQTRAAEIYICLMLKPLVEKRRRDRINQSLEELRLLLLQRTHCQTLKKPKVEKAEILEMAVRYLREMTNVTPPGADLSENRTLQTCYMMGFRECLLGLAAFIQQAHPSAQSRLLDTLHLYLEAHPQDWSYAAFSPSPSSLEGSPPRTPEAFSSPVKTLDEPLRPNPDPTCSGTGPLESRRRDAHEGTSSPTKRMVAPPPAFWRPWP